MSSTWGFSPSQNVFYPMEMQQDYEAAGSWPPDIVEVDDAIANEYRGTPPAGKVRGVVDGSAWVDIVIPPAEAYSTALNTLRVNGINAAQAIQVPYSFEEAATWWVQAQEAAAWTADNNFNPNANRNGRSLKWRMDIALSCSKYRRKLTGMENGIWEYSRPT
jgi:hypothetical protein